MKKVVFPLVVLCLLFSCQEEESLVPNEKANPLVQLPIDSIVSGGGGSGGGSSNNEFFNYMVDGVNYMRTNPTFQDGGAVIQILSHAGVNNAIQIALPSNITIPDTTIFDVFSNTVAYIESPSKQYSARRGQMVITSSDATKMTGTFTFVGFFTSTDSVIVSSGSFLVHK